MTHSRVFTAYIIADYQGSMRMRTRKPRPDEITALEYVFTVRLHVPQPDRVEVTADLFLPEPDGNPNVEVSSLSVEP